MDRKEDTIVSDSQRQRIEETEALNQWLTEAKAGDDAARTRLFAWVHEHAFEYYSVKAGIEPLLTFQDAQDLASESIVEISKCWTRIRSMSHYCRRMYKNNLCRFLRRKRAHLSRVCPLVDDQVEAVSRESVSIQPTFEMERYSDDDKRMLRYITRELHASDRVMQDLVHFRITAGNLTYSEIGNMLGATETSLRMRMKRFTDRIQRGYERENLGRSESVSAPEARLST